MPLYKHLHPRTVIILLLVTLLALPAILVSAQTIVEAPSAKEEITVTAWGTLQIIQTYKFVNVGNTTIPSTVISLPKAAYDITATDDLGTITSSVGNSETGKNVTVTFRYPLRGEVEGVVYKDAYTFSVRYTLASSAYLRQPEFGVFRLEFNASTGVEFPVAECVVIVILPEGSSFSSSEPAGSVRVMGLSPVVSYTFTGLEPKDEFHIQVSYHYLPIWGAFRPTLWVGTIAAITGVALLLRRRFRKAEIREEGVDVGLLRDFVNSLDEELGLWEDLDQLEQALDNGKLGRKDYNRRRRVLDERSRALSGSLSRLKQEVRQISARYARIVEQVEAAESEMAKLWNNFSRLRAQFRAGRLSRSSFENLEETHRRRAGKVRATIEAVIIELRSDLG